MSPILIGVQRIRTWVELNVVVGLRVPPTSDDWRAAAMAIPYAIVAILLGLRTGLLELSLPTWWEVIFIPPLLVLYPALLEEAIFRGVLLPRSLVDAPLRCQAIVVASSTALFVAMHPVNHWLVGLSDTSSFTDPVFLVIVTLLGLTCAVQRLLSPSLWLPIGTHWGTVVMWNLFFGRDLAL